MHINSSCPLLCEYIQFFTSRFWNLMLQIQSQVMSNHHHYQLRSKAMKNGKLRRFSTPVFTDDGFSISSDGLASMNPLGDRQFPLNTPPILWNHSTIDTPTSPAPQLPPLSDHVSVHCHVLMFEEYLTDAMDSFNNARQHIGHVTQSLDSALVHHNHVLSHGNKVNVQTYLDKL